MTLLVITLTALVSVAINLDSQDSSRYTVKRDTSIKLIDSLQMKRQGQDTEHYRPQGDSHKRKLNRSRFDGQRGNDQFRTLEDMDQRWQDMDSSSFRGPRRR